jgi:hypothetical protein
LLENVGSHLKRARGAAQLTIIFFLYSAKFNESQAIRILINELSIVKALTKSIKDGVFIPNIDYSFQPEYHSKEAI